MKLTILYHIDNENEIASFKHWYQGLKTRIKYLFNLEKKEVEIHEHDIQNLLEENLQLSKRSVIMPVITSDIDKTEYWSLINSYADQGYIVLPLIKEYSTQDIKRKLAQYKVIPLTNPEDDLFTIMERKTNNDGLEPAPELHLIKPLISELSKIDIQLDESGKKKQIGVYVGFTGEDLFYDRAMLISELKSRGYIVYPEKDIFQYPNQAENIIKESIENSQVHIMMMGENPSPNLPGTETPLIEIENKYSYDRYVHLEEEYEINEKVPELRIIQVREDFEQFSEKRKKRVHSLITDKEYMTGSIIAKVTGYRLKHIILEKLENKNITGWFDDDLDTDEDQNKTYTCILCNENNKPNTQYLTEILKNNQQDYFYLSSDNNNNGSDMYKNCHSLIIYGKGENQFWLRSKLNQLSKYSGYNNSLRTLKCTAIISDITIDVNQFLLSNIISVHPENETLEDNLEPFFDILNTSLV